MLHKVEPGVFFVAYMFVDDDGVSSYASMTMEFSQPDSIANLENYRDTSIERRIGDKPFSVIAWSRLQ